MQIFSPVVGVSFRGTEARNLVKSLTPEDGIRLSLEAEPDNEYDRNAVMVLCDGEHIGYIARENNRQLFDALQAGGQFTIDIVSFENTIKPVLLISSDVVE